MGGVDERLVIKFNFQRGERRERREGGRERERERERERRKREREWLKFGLKDLGGSSWCGPQGDRHQHWPYLLAELEDLSYQRGGFDLARNPRLKKA